MVRLAFLPAVLWVTGLVSGEMKLSCSPSVYRLADTPLQRLIQNDLHCCVRLVSNNVEEISCKSLVVLHKSSRFLHYAKLFLSLELCPSCASHNAAVRANLKKSVSFLIAGFLYLDNSEGPSAMFSVGALSSVKVELSLITLSLLGHISCLFSVCPCFSFSTRWD